LFLLLEFFQLFNRSLQSADPLDERGVTAPELRDYLRDKVVRWWLPERWTFIDEMPKKSVGKFDKS
jgi:acyl-CoA synthetase (AMP-forming)/AMP-acid ligase II